MSLNFSTEILLKVIMSDPYSRQPRESAVKRLLLVASGLRSYLKPATHLAILYADRRDRRIKSPISGMSDIGD